MLTLKHQYKGECDSMRLLADEFEEQVEDYNNRNKRYREELEAFDCNEYAPPKYISNYKAILTSSLIFQAQGLLDFFLPVIVKHISKPQDIHPFDGSGNGNVLDWTKESLKKLGLNYDFSCGPYSKLKDFYRFRNDLVHKGGYVLSENNKKRIAGIAEIEHCEYTDLYIIEFSYCRSVIDYIEDFFDQIYVGMNK
jgi:hypothetical protein